MRPTNRLQIEQLDAELRRVVALGNLSRPQGGWVKAIRAALGMTTRQFARRLGISQPGAVALENAERRDAVTLKRLRAAAAALDCELVYALLPRRPLVQVVEECAREKARQEFKVAGHNMALEDQRVADSALDAMVERRAQELLQERWSKLWG